MWKHSSNFVGCALMYVAVLTIAACHGAKSPDALQTDIADAHQSAVQEVAKAEQTEHKDLTTDAYKVAVAQADGDHKIAIQRCDALQGHEQKQCKDQADADYEAATANAKASRVAAQP
jgi:hypothetical protein